jgi:glycosyltransferase involved in cell wall biosynthesis
MRFPGRRRDAVENPGPSTALLSVVVPAYQVEDYLEACLASILTQSHTHLDVVVVDDGSTDRTGEIADRIATEDPRVRVVHQDNAGLGAARNEGVRHGTGEFLTFADSDDLILPDAYALMVGTLEATGSDFAVGAVERLRDEQRIMMPLMAENHQESAYRRTVEQAPLLLADVFAWNKVYRRSFWDANALSFPAGVRYEDQPTLTRAFVAASAFDVLADPVYLWRVRSDGTSISQQRADPRDLADRILTKRWSTDVVVGATSAKTRRTWFARVLPVDMWEYFRAVPGCTPEYWSMLRDGVLEFWNDDTVPFERTGLPLRQRLMGWLVTQDQRSDLEELIAFIDAHPGGLPRRVVDGREVVDHPFRDRPGLPPELLA